MILRLKSYELKFLNLSKEVQCLFYNYDLIKKNHISRVQREEVGREGDAAPPVLGACLGCVLTFDSANVACLRGVSSW